MRQGTIAPKLTLALFWMMRTWLLLWAPILINVTSVPTGGAAASPQSSTV